ncbi:MAG: hypothetical protein C0412_16190 [Flavobacterium sp.]|nr:hypothetical protein [Flavobacterium sp.]
MKYLFVFIVISCSFLVGQQRDYGERNGYDWKDFYNQSELLFSKVDWSNKQEWIDIEARSRKTMYLIGIYDLSTRMPSDYYTPYLDKKGKTQYVNFGNPYPYTIDTTPDQMLKALDDFYSDYRNMNVKILEAIHVCQMGIKGESNDDIEWQTRYYRSDSDGKTKMTDEKYNIK